MQTRRCYRFESWYFDIEQAVLSRDGEDTHLAPQSRKILLHLVENQGRLISLNELFEKVWGIEESAELNEYAIRFHIHEIRKALGDDRQAPRYIRTVPKQGYKFIAEVTEVPCESWMPTAPESAAPDSPDAGILIDQQPAEAPHQSSKEPEVSNRLADTAAPLDWQIQRELRSIPSLRPLPEHGVFGREQDLLTIADLLRLTDPAATDVPPVALRGWGGIGKTTVAIKFWHESRSCFPDGVLGAELGLKPVIRNLLTEWADKFNLDLRASYDERACSDRLRDALYGRRCLLLVDDVWETRHGNYFKVGGPYCRTIFTTREVPVAHALATSRRTLPLDFLSMGAAMDMFRNIAPEAVAADEQAVRRLCERLDRLPLALKLAARLLADEAGVPSRMRKLIDTLIEDSSARLALIQAEGRLGIAEHESPTLGAILGLSVSRLDELDQRQFATLGAMAKEPATWNLDVLALGWECTLEEAEATVSHFYHRGLVERRGDRFWMHTLLMDYANDLEKKLFS